MVVAAWACVPSSLVAEDDGAGDADDELDDLAGKVEGKLFKTAAW